MIYNKIFLASILSCFLINPSELEKKDHASKQAQESQDVYGTLGLEDPNDPFFVRVESFYGDDEAEIFDEKNITGSKCTLE